MKVDSIQERLLKNSEQGGSVVDELAQCGAVLLEMVGASGVVLCLDERYVSVGEVLHEAEMKQLVRWLELQSGKGEGIFYSDALAMQYAGAKRYKDVACGLLAVCVVAENWIMWFRPAVGQTMVMDEKHTIIGAEYAKPWQEDEIAAARMLRNLLVGRLFSKR